MVILLVSVKYIAIPFPPESCLRSQSAPGWVLDGRFASGANRLVRPEIDRPAAGSFRIAGLLDWECGRPFRRLNSQARSACSCRDANILSFGCSKGS